MIIQKTDSAPDSVIIAIDQSTSGTKALAFDSSGRPLHRVTIEHEQFYSGPGLVEHDALEILANVRKAVLDLVAQAGIDPVLIATLALTNQRETILAWDSHSGVPVHRALVWQDRRGGALCESLNARGHGEMVKARTGLPLDPMFSASKLAWLAHDCEAAKASLAAGTLMAGTIDSWLVWNLTGRRVFACDYSNASRTMLFNIHMLEWDREILRIFGLEGVRLPEVRRSDSGFGEADFPELGRKIPIGAVMGDSHAALFGHRGWNPGEAKATYGTGSSVMSFIGPDPGTSPSGVVLSLAWGYRGKADYVLEGNIQSTGDTIRWLRDNLGLFSTYTEAETMAASLPDSGGVSLVPSFSGLGAPWWTDTDGALICGMRRGCDKRHIVRAGLESIAFQIADLVDEMNRQTGLCLTALHVDGGPTRNGFLMQFQADILGIPVLVPSIEEISALGVALMAGLSSGTMSATTTGGVKEYLPRMRATEAAALKDRWHAAIDTVTRRKHS